MIQNKFKSIFLAIVICLLGATTTFAQDTEEVITDSVEMSVRTEEYTKNCSKNPIYEKMLALKGQYPEGMPWTDENRYDWKGGIYSWGTGCLGFAFILSDAAFGNSPARKHYDFNNLRVGDILRMDGDTHSVVIICINSTTVVLAEGNYDASIHWGRTLSIDEVKSSLDYVITRYPK